MFALLYSSLHRTLEMGAGESNWADWIASGSLCTNQCSIQIFKWRGHTTDLCVRYSEIPIRFRNSCMTKRPFCSNRILLLIHFSYLLIYIANSSTCVHVLSYHFLSTCITLFLPFQLKKQPEFTSQSVHNCLFPINLFYVNT